jgi:hypothetical protein
VQAASLPNSIICLRIILYSDGCVNQRITSFLLGMNKIGPAAESCRACFALRELTDQKA